MLALGDMAGNAEVSFIQHDGVIDPLSDMATGRTAAGQIQMHVLRMGRYGWLRMTRLAIDSRLMMIRMTAFTICLLPKRGPAGMTRGTPYISVNIMIENQGTRPEFGRRQPESYNRTHGFRCNLPHRMAAPALRVPHIHMVTVRTPFPIRNGRRRSGTVALGALVGRVKLMLKTRQVRTRLAMHGWRVNQDCHTSHRNSQVTVHGAGTDVRSGTTSAYPR